MSNLSQAVAQREQLRLLHNEPGKLGDMEWRNRIFKSTQLAITKRLQKQKKRLPISDNEMEKSVGLSRMKWPVHTSKWDQRLEHIHRLQDSRKDWIDPGEGGEDDGTTQVILNAYNELKHTIDNEHLGKALPLIDKTPHDFPDPIEDFRTHTARGPDTHQLSVSADTIWMLNILLNDDVSVYRDMDPNYFWHTFEHLTEFSGGSGNYSGCSHWMISNTALNMLYVHNTSLDGVLIFRTGSGLHPQSNQYLRNRVSGEEASDAFVTTAGGVRYYDTITRAEGTISAEYRITSHAGSLQDTLSVSLAPANTFRYVTPMSSYDANNACCQGSHYVYNLDLQWEWPPTPLAGGAGRSGSIILNW